MKNIEKILLLTVVALFFSLIACEDDEAFVEKKPVITLVSPINKANGVDIAPSFEWEASDPNEKSLKYDFYLGLDSTKLFLQAENIIKTNYQLKDYKLRKDVSYYWRVVAKNGIQQKESEIWSFFSIPAPSAPVLVSPTEGSYVRDALTFKWDPVPAGEDETISYNVFFGKVNPPTEKIALVDDGSVEFTLDASTLELGKVYYWKVEATDLVNTSSSEIRSFKKLAPGSPDEPFLLTPVNKAAVQSGVALDWTDVVDPDGDAVSYDVYLDKVNPPVALAGNVTTSQYTTSALDANSAYYWYVVAKDPAGNATKSEVFGFSAVNSTPGFPGIHDFAVKDVLSLDETLVWDAAQGATSYDVYVDTVNPPVKKVASDITNTSYLVKNIDVPNNITNVKTYYVRVIAKDGSGNETHSFPVAFTPQMTGTITDARGAEVNNYKWVRVGTQIWMSENLRTKKLTNGSDLVITTTAAGVPNITAERYGEHPEGVEGFTPNWVNTYGRTYTTALARNPLLPPNGWHLPTKTEKDLLQTYTGQKPKDLLGLWYPWATDLYGLNFAPAGFSSTGGAAYRYSDEKDIAYFWIDGVTNGVWGISGNPSGNWVFREFPYNSVGILMSVRLIKD